MSESRSTSSTAAARDAVPRDPAMDLVRVLCVVLVVAGHLLMIGANIVPGRGLVVERTLLETPWIGPLTWIAQIMPLFFVVGGFAGIGAWRRLEASGGTASDFIRSRVLRLARPSIALFATLAAAILVMHLTGVDPESMVAVHAEAFAKLTPEQRRLVYQSLADQAPAGERLDSDDPSALARAATRQELRQPGSVERAFANADAAGRRQGVAGPSMGGMFASSLLGTVAGVVVGSAIAQAFLPDPSSSEAGADGSGDAGGSGDGGGGAGADASADAGGYDGGGYDGGGFGDFGGGDFGGGDFGF